MRYFSTDDYSANAGDSTSTEEDAGTHDFPEGDRPTIRMPAARRRAILAEDRRRAIRGD